MGEGETLGSAVTAGVEFAIVDAGTAAQKTTELLGNRLLRREAIALRVQEQPGAEREQHNDADHSQKLHRRLDDIALFPFFAHMEMIAHASNPVNFCQSIFFMR